MPSMNVVDTMFADSRFGSDDPARFDGFSALPQPKNLTRVVRVGLLQGVAAACDMTLARWSVSISDIDHVLEDKLHRTLLRPVLAGVSGYMHRRVDELLVPPGERPMRFEKTGSDDVPNPEAQRAGIFG